MSVSVKECLARNNNRVRALESHDLASREIIRNTIGANGDAFHGFWISSLSQTTQLGLPDTELLSPLTRALLLAYYSPIFQPRGGRPICGLYDCDSGGPLEEIPALVAVLEKLGVSMLIVEDKAVSEPGKKVNSFAESTGPGCLANPHDFAKTLQAFKAATKGRNIMVGARIEALTARIVLKNDPVAEAASLAETQADAQYRAAIYRDEGGADAIMIHSKIPDPREVLSWLAAFRAQDATTPVVLVPSAYPSASHTALFDAGANIIIYAHHLFRGKMWALKNVTENMLAGGTGTRSGLSSGVVSSSSSYHELQEAKSKIIASQVETGKKKRLLSIIRARLQALKSPSPAVVIEVKTGGRPFADDAELQRCLDARNYSALYHKVLEHKLSGNETQEEKAYWDVAEKAAIQNMTHVARLLIEGNRAGDECTDFVIDMKELMEVNGKQLLTV